MVMIPEGCFAYAPPKVKEAWKKLVAVVRKQKLTESSIALVYQPPQELPCVFVNGGWYPAGRTPDEWFIGSASQDGNPTIIYTPVSDRWRLRDQKTGNDESVGWERVVDTISNYGVF